MEDFISSQQIDLADKCFQVVARALQQIFTDVHDRLLGRRFQNRLQIIGVHLLNGDAYLQRLQF